MYFCGTKSAIFAIKFKEFHEIVFYVLFENWITQHVSLGCLGILSCDSMVKKIPPSPGQSSVDGITK